jgi:hypothetical protein
LARIVKNQFPELRRVSLQARKISSGYYLLIAVLVQNLFLIWLAGGLRPCTIQERKMKVPCANSETDKIINRGPPKK